MASDIILGWLGLFIQLNAAFVIFLWLIPPFRKTVYWLRHRTDEAIASIPRSTSESGVASNVMEPGGPFSKLYFLVRVAQLVLYGLGLLYLVGTMIMIFTGVWFWPLVAVYWILIAGAGIAQPISDFFWPITFLFWPIAITLGWIGYKILFKRYTLRENTRPSSDNESRVS